MDVDGQRDRVGVTVTVGRRQVNRRQALGIVS